MDFEDIYKNYGKIVYGYLLNKCHSPALVEDLTQDKFVIAYKN